MIGRGAESAGGVAGIVVIGGIAGAGPMCAVGAGTISPPASSTSMRLACCSTARSASQLVNEATSSVRRGASIEPLSAITTSGRVSAGAPATSGPDKTNRASMTFSARSMLPVGERSAPWGRTSGLPSRSWPLLTMSRPSAIGIGRLPFANASSMRSWTRIGSIGRPWSMARATASNAAGLSRMTRPSCHCKLPLPLSDPISAIGLRPVPTRSTSTDSRPDIGGRPSPGKSSAISAAAILT